MKLPNVLKISKNVARDFYEAAKVFWVDAAICLFALVVIVVYATTNIPFMLEGAAGTLFVYSFFMVIRLNWFRNKIAKLEKK